jgi:Ca-activated chloride channel family protein
VGDAERKFDFPGTLVEKSSEQTYAFVEKLWAMRRIGEIIDELDLKGKNDELVNELVSLSTKHGILTQYTSFLADENAPVRDFANLGENFRRAEVQLEQLQATDGLQGVAQRADKKSLQEAAQPAAAASPAFGIAGAGGYGSGEARSRGGASAMSGLRASNSYRDAATDREVYAGGIQNAGKETLYKRGNLWIATNAQKIDPEKDEGKIKRVKRFSDEYFEIARANTSDENAVLASQQEGEELLVVLRGQAYRFE